MWERRSAALAFVLALGIAATIVAAQPLRSPWWTYADADASYTGVALNLVAGHPAQFVDHPGLPLTEATALVFGADALLRGNVSRADREAPARTLRKCPRTTGTTAGRRVRDRRVVVPLSSASVKVS